MYDTPTNSKESKQMTMSSQNRNVRMPKPNLGKLTKLKSLGGGARRVRKEETDENSDAFSDKNNIMDSNDRNDRDQVKVAIVDSHMEASSCVNDDTMPNEQLNKRIVRFVELPDDIEFKETNVSSNEQSVESFGGSILDHPHLPDPYKLLNYRETISTSSVLSIENNNGSSAVLLLSYNSNIINKNHQTLSNNKIMDEKDFISDLNNLNTKDVETNNNNDNNNTCTMTTTAAASTPIASTATATTTTSTTTTTTTTAASSTSSSTNSNGNNNYVDDVTVAMDIEDEEQTLPQVINPSSSRNIEMSESTQDVIFKNQLPQIDKSSNSERTEMQLPIVAAPLPVYMPNFPVCFSQEHCTTTSTSVDSNFIFVNGNSYRKLEVVGRGGSSKVYKVISSNNKIYALKKVKLEGVDSITANGFSEEIRLLNLLKGKKNVVQLIESELDLSQSQLLLVMEFGDIDLNRLLSKIKGGGVDENYLRLYWQQMLEAVKTIHDERIVHSDLKPANFLVVEGQLKLIDFGIAKSIQNDTTNIVRESQMGTLNYMSPEAIIGGGQDKSQSSFKLGRASDIWSLGCILYQMVYGSTPFSKLNMIQKMKLIPDENYAISYPPIPSKNEDLLNTLKLCLVRNPLERASIPQLLVHRFLNPTTAYATSRDSEHTSDNVSIDEVRTLLKQLATSAGIPLGSSPGRDMTSELLRKIRSGESVNLTNFVKNVSMGNKK